MDFVDLQRQAQQTFDKLRVARVEESFRKKAGGLPFAALATLTFIAAGCAGYPPPDYDGEDAHSSGKLDYENCHAL